MTREYGVWDLETAAYRSFAVAPAGSSFGSVAGWLPDSRHFIARSADGVVLIDSVSGSSRVLVPCEPGDTLALSHDGRTLSVEHEVLDSDIWLLERR